MKKLINLNSQYATDAFMEFWLCGETKAHRLCPDREKEDFSPEAELDIAYIESFADKEPDRELSLIA